MIIEGILTTEAVDRRMHVSAIGPHVNPELTQWTLKPFKSSTSYGNLRLYNRSVFHVVDDAILLVEAVLGKLNLREENSIAQYHESIGWIINDACRVFGLKVVDWDLSNERAIATCEVTFSENRRPFFGWNRAANSVLELAIHATRRHLLSKEFLQQELDRHKLIIEKTAGPRELRAWELLKEDFRTA